MSGNRRTANLPCPHLVAISSSVLTRRRRDRELNHGAAGDLVDLACRHIIAAVAYSPPLPDPDPIRSAPLPICLFRRVS
uniref:Uncharacterized protein n=1 Tax=Oryza glumipatula TaxID=40148 RepID=A0A0D9YCW3_9ORYZ